MTKSFSNFYLIRPQKFKGYPQRKVSSKSAPCRLKSTFLFSKFQLMRKFQIVIQQGYQKRTWPLGFSSCMLPRKKPFPIRVSTFNIDNLKQCSYLKCSYLKMGSHGNALAVSFFRRRARLRRSHAHDFLYSIEKRCGKLGRHVSFNESQELYRKLEITDLSRYILNRVTR